MAGDYGNGGDLVPDNGDMGPQDEQGGYCIEIYVGADNQVNGVKVEQKMMMEGGEMETETKMPVQSIDEALSMAKGIYESGGQMHGGDMGQMQGQGSAEQSQMKGYGRGSFANQQGVPVRKVFTDTM
jgi:hypothetical protein